GWSAPRMLDRTPGIFELHSLYFGKQPGKVVVVENLEIETDTRGHDAGRAGRGQFEAIAVLLPRSDLAFGRLSPDAVAINDEARAIKIGKLGKHDLIALLSEHQLAKIGLRGPGAGEFKGPHLE